MRYPRLRSGPAAFVLGVVAVLLLICVAGPCAAISYYAPWTYGQGRFCSTGVGDRHAGNLFDAFDFRDAGIEGSYMRASAPGTVSVVYKGCPGNHYPYGTGTECHGWGNYVIVKHANGQYTRYAHMLNTTANPIKVKAGDSVAQGQVLGYVGNTGNSSGPHIHFQVQNSQSGSAVYFKFADIGLPHVNVEYFSGNIEGPVDYDPPTISITPSAAPNSSGWYTTAQSVSWKAIDLQSGVDHTKVWWDSETPTSVAPEGSWAMREGVYTFCVHSADNAGNESKTKSSPELKLDKTKPKITLTTPVANQMYTTTQVVKWTVTDTVTGVNAVSGVKGVQIQWDSSTPVPSLPNATPASGSVSVPNDGVFHTFKIRAYDNAGNTTAWSSSYGPFGVNLVGAVIGFNGPEEREWLNSAQTISWIVTGATSVKLQWDGGTLNTVTAIGSTPIPEGIHTAKLVAYDTAGTDVDGGEYWIDLHAPTLVPGSLETPAESGTLSTLSATWQFSDLVAGVNQVSGVVEYDYWIGTTPGDDDVLEATSNTAPWAWAPNLELINGQTYYITVRACDAAGNWSSTYTSDGIVATLGTNDAASLVDSGGTSVTPRTADGCHLVDSIGQFAVGDSVSELGYAEHGYWHSDVLVPSEESIAGSRLQYDGTPVALGTADRPIIVTAPTSAFAQRFYVEQVERIGGIAVEYGPLGGTSLTEGDRVWLTGQMQTVGQERVIRNAQAFVLGHLDPVLAPLLMASKAVGGSDDNPLTTDIPGSVGLYNVGLLVRICGRVNAADPGGQFFYLDDGAGLNGGVLVNGVPAKGMRVCLAGLAAGNSITPLSNGTYAVVTGIVSMSWAPGPLRAQIRPRTQADILPIAE